MRKKLTTKRIIRCKLIVLSMLAIACSKEENSDSVIEEAIIQSETNLVRTSIAQIPNQYIVTLEKGTFIQEDNRGSINYNRAKESRRNQLLSSFSKVKLSQEVIYQTYGNAIEGFTAKLSEDQVEMLRNDNRVVSIEQDFMYTLSPVQQMGKPGGNGDNDAPQEVPYGTTRVGGFGDGTGKTAWVIDSGIDLDHPDLNVDVQRSVSFLSGSPSNQTPEDYNGHGTHVAGTIAAIDNEIGTVGVAQNATVVAVRVLDRRGSGSNSGVIAGVDYVAANGNNGDVANMSLGGGISTALDNAVISAASTGVKFTLAAGNESRDANTSSPARANGNNIYTISAMNSNDQWASFSNYGSSVDYCSPGVAVKSAWKDGGYNTISGTSMAAPHMAGILLLGNPRTDGFVSGDPDGNPDPIAVIQ